MLAWVNPGMYWPKKGRKQKGIDEETSAASLSRRKIDDALVVSKRSHPFTDKTLDPRSGILKDRVDSSGH